MFRNSSGFTLIEVLIAIVVAGVLGALATSQLAVFSASHDLVKSERAKEDNRKAGLGLLEEARENNGRLPAPYTGGAFNSVVADPANASLVSNLINSGLENSTINSDGSIGQRVRAYQRITVTENVPFFLEGGETVSLVYDIGVVYQTNCLITDTSCNPSSTGLSGSSALLTSSNVQTWDVTGTDRHPYMFSTFKLQRQMVNKTVDKMMAIRDALKTAFYNAMLSSPPGDATNFYPAPLGAGAPDLSGADVTLNEGCRDGWYALNASSVNVLSQINLVPSSYYGITSFGGRIEYCRDYDPSNTTANSPPHGVAIRINRSISTGAAPAASGNLILSF